jgi:hypothetical protein
MHVRGAAVLCLALLLSILPLSAAHAAQLSSEDARAKPKPPAGFPVAPGVYRLDGSDPNLETADLEPLRQIVGGAQVVALGESLHTVGGYYEMKHRVFRFLVEKMGFRAISFESNWEAAEQVEHYVQTCEGSPEEAVDHLMDIFNSTETAALAQWVCEWNRSHPKPRDKVHVFGFDIQEPNLDGPARLCLHRPDRLGGRDRPGPGLRRTGAAARLGGSPPGEPGARLPPGRPGLAGPAPLLRAPQDLRAALRPRRAPDLFRRPDLAPPCGKDGPAGLDSVCQ